MRGGGVDPHLGEIEQQRNGQYSTTVGSANDIILSW